MPGGPLRRYDRIPEPPPEEIEARYNQILELINSIKTVDDWPVYWSRAVDLRKNPIVIKYRRREGVNFASRTNQVRLKDGILREQKDDDCRAVEAGEPVVRVVNPRQDMSREFDLDGYLSRQFRPETANIFKKGLIYFMHVGMGDFARQADLGVQWPPLPYPDDVIPDMPWVPAGGIQMRFMLTDSEISIMKDALEKGYTVVGAIRLTLADSGTSSNSHMIAYVFDRTRFTFLEVFDTDTMFIPAKLDETPNWRKTIVDTMFRPLLPEAERAGLLIGRTKEGVHFDPDVGLRSAEYPCVSYALNMITNVLTTRKEPGEFLTLEQLEAAANLYRKAGRRRRTRRIKRRRQTRRRTYKR
jgi:hypothetical protein